MSIYSETDNPVQGTDNAQTQADDTANDWDFHDPDEDQDTVEVQQEEATDDGAEVAEEVASTEETAETEEIEASADAVVTMSDGSKVKVSELIQGQLRQADYSRKTQELANDRTALKADVDRIEGVTQALVDHLLKLVPEMPDISLLYSNPVKHAQLKGTHEAAMAQLQSLIKIGEEPKAIAGKLSQDDMTRRAIDEGAKLTERFPEIANPQARQKFLSDAVKTASEFGVTIEDLQANPDHRIFAALHYAAKGLQAEKSMQAAKAKAVKAPPMAVQKPAHVIPANADALKRFQKSPNLRNAAAAWNGD